MQLKNYSWLGWVGWSLWRRLVIVAVITLNMSLTESQYKSEILSLIVTSTWQLIDIQPQYIQLHTLTHNPTSGLKKRYIHRKSSARMIERFREFKDWRISDRMEWYSLLKWFICATVAEDDNSERGMWGSLLQHHC